MITGCKLLPGGLGPMLSQMAGEKLESVFRVWLSYVLLGALRAPGEAMRSGLGRDGGDPGGMSMGWN